MIAVIGVIILVIAAIGIIMFVPEDDGKGGDGDGADDFKKYLVTHEMKEETADITSDSEAFTVSDKLIGDGSYMGEVSIPSTDLKCVKFFVEYEDNIKINFLGNIGADTLTFTVYDENDNQLDSKSIQKIGNDTITVDANNPPLTIREIVAENENDAWDRLEENKTDIGMQKTYKITVSVDQKETILRPIAWLLEKLMQDKFTLTVTYEYYDYKLEEAKDDEGDDPPADKKPSSLGTITYGNTFMPMGKC